MLKKISVLLFLVFISCNIEQPTQFSEEALNDKVYDLANKEFSFEQVLNQHKEKKILIDIWASWCRDCIVGMPKVKQLQKEFPEVVYLFLSVDTKQGSWKRGIQRYNIQGKHYNLPQGTKKGALVDFLNVSWIPRYVVVDENGKISMFKATDASDKSIKKAFQKSI